MSFSLRLKLPDMKLLYIIYSSAVVLLPMVNWSEGQSYYNVSKFFANMSFGQVHRGTFNMSECAEDMISCWENIFPSTVCHQWIHFATVCDMMREYCIDYGYSLYWWHRWFLTENYCLYWWVQYSETRRAGSGRGLLALNGSVPAPQTSPGRAELSHHLRYHGSYNFHFVPEL